MRKLAVVLILALLVLLVFIPSEVRAALVQVKEPGLFQQISSAYPNDQVTSTELQSSAYPIESGTPPTASFGTSQSTTRTPTHTPTRTIFQTTGFVTATSSYANTAAAIRTMNAMTLEAATRNSPLYTPGTPQPSAAATETPTMTSTSMPSWTPSPSITIFPTIITTPRVLEKGTSKNAVDLQAILIGLGILGLSCILIVGIWYFRKKH